MKNKKILNVSLLSLSLITLITFLLPISKINFTNSMFVKIMYYATSGIMLAGLGVVVLITIINLFKDEYKNLKMVEGIILFVFLMVFTNLLLFASLQNVTINLRYILVCVEIFIAATLSQTTRLFQSKSEYKIQLKELLKNPKLEERKKEKALKKANNYANKKSKNKMEKNNNGEISFNLQNNLATNSESGSDVYETENNLRVNEIKKENKTQES